MSTQPGASKPPDRFARRLTIGFCLVALVLGAFEAWEARFDMNPDGIQYLDNASLYAHGDFQNALNTQWSPLYPWLIVGAEAIVRPSREQEFALAHGVNFAVLAASIGCFLFFLKSLPQPAPGGLLLLSYAAFLYCTLDFTHLRYVTPDLLVNCFAFAVAGLLARIANGAAKPRLHAALGLALALGYLAKAPFLPIAIVCLSLACLFDWKRAVVSAAVFLCATGLYVAALSQAKHRFTFGDSAKLNLAWHVDGLPNVNWQGGPGENGQPAHPTREMSAHPAIFEFGEPVAGTYPPWYDPSYWNEGVRVTYDTRQVLRAIAKQVWLYAYWFHHRQSALIFALIASWFISRGKTQIRARLKELWPVIAIAAAPFVVYAPVHAEGRYLAPFFVILWIAAFACVGDHDRASIAIATTVALLMCVESAAATVATLRDEPPARLHFQIARDLQSLGLKPKDRVAMVSGILPYYWAYLSGARIAIQISFDGDSAAVREAEWQTARSILTSQITAYVVSPATDGVTNQPGWIPIATQFGVPPRVFAYPIHPHSAY
jgi:hypothetical protein